MSEQQEAILLLKRKIAKMPGVTLAASEEPELVKLLAFDWDGEPKTWVIRFDEKWGYHINEFWGHDDTNEWIGDTLGSHDSLLEAVRRLIRQVSKDYREAENSGVLPSQVREISEGVTVKRFQKLAGLLKEQIEELPDDNEAYVAIDHIMQKVITGKQSVEEAVTEIHKLKEKWHLDQLDIQMYLEAGEYASVAAEKAFRHAHSLVKTISKRI